MIATTDRTGEVDFAHYFWIEPYVMIVPKPEEEPRLFAFVRPFDSMVKSSCSRMILSRNRK